MSTLLSCPTSIAGYKRHDDSCMMPAVRALQRDAILKVTSTAICGSDLHMYMGAMPGMRKGDLLGHEVRSTRQSTGRLQDLHMWPSACPCHEGLTAQDGCTRSSWASWRTWAIR